MKKTYRRKKIPNSKLLSRYVAKQLRNSILEDYHAEMPEFTDARMHELMLDFEDILGGIFSYLQEQKLAKFNLDKMFSIHVGQRPMRDDEGKFLYYLGYETLRSNRTFRDQHTDILFDKHGISWDDPTLDKFFNKQDEK